MSLFQTPRAVAKTASRLTRRHSTLLNNGEKFESVCEGFAAYLPHPESRGWRISKPTLSHEERLASEGLAHLRLSAVRTVLGMIDGEFVDLPASDDGYLLARTDRRLLFFDGAGQRLLREDSLTGVFLQAVDHDDAMFTLVLIMADDRLAIATRRERESMSTHFIKSFPDRRAEPRIIIADDHDPIPDL